MQRQARSTCLSAINETKVETMLRKQPLSVFRLLLLALIVAAFVLPAPVAVAQAAKPSATVLVTKLNVRAGPGTNYAVLGQVSASNVLPVVGQAQNCGWLKVQTQQMTGWVSGLRQYVRLSTTCNDIPAAAATASATAVATPPPTESQPAANPPATPVPATPVPATTPTATQSAADRLPADKGCFLMINHVGPELNVTLTNKDNGKSENFRVPASGQAVWCLDGGRYAATIDAPPPWSSLNTDFSISAGDRFEWPIAGRE